MKMKYKVNLMINIKHLIRIALVFHITSLIIFSERRQTIFWANFSYILLISLTLIYVLMSKKITLTKNFKFYMAFAFYSFASFFWSLSPNETITRTYTFLMISIMVIVLVSYFASSGETDFIPYAIFVSGQLVILYVIYKYGLSNLVLLLSSGERIGGLIANENTLGMFMANTTIISYYYGYIKNNKIYYLLSVLQLIISLSTGSKKGFLIIVAGIVLIHLYANKRKPNVLRITRGVMIASILVFTLFQFIKLPMFSTIYLRLEIMISTFLSQESRYVDYSTLERIEMIRIGMSQFIRTPIFGIGIGSASYLTMQTFGVSSYLHNNYVELLATGGIIGFMLYYINIFYILIGLFKILKARNSMAVIAFILLFTQLLLDFGAVSYFSRITHIYIIFGIATVYNWEKENMHDIRRIHKGTQVTSNLDLLKGINT